MNTHTTKIAWDGVTITESQKKILISISVLLLSSACAFVELPGMANAADTVVSGTISLPSRVAPYSKEKLIRISLMTGKVGPNFQHFFQCTNVILPANQKTIPYQCWWPEGVGLTGEFGIYVDTTSHLPDYFDPDMPGIYHSAYYTSTGSKTGEQYAEVFDAGATYVDKDITLIPTLTVKVVMETPPGESFDVDQDLIVDLLGNIYSEDGRIYWTYTQGGEAKWVANSEQFEITYEIQDYIEGDFIFRYKFAEGFGLGFLEEGYYSESGAVPTIDQATLVSSSTSKLDLNMNLKKSTSVKDQSSLVPMLHLLLLND